MTGKTVDSVTTSYTYDAIDQLLSETRSGYAASYTYDANGNRATRTVNGLTETYTNDAGDKLTSVTWTGGSKTYGYDAAGRTTSITTSAGTTNLVYDYESRVTSISYPGGSSDTFTYSGLDTRVGKGGSQGAFTFKRDGVDVTDPVLNDGAANYTPGVSERRSGTTKFNVSDYIGTNSRQLDASQATSATRQYDAFGNLISSTGSPTGQPPFGWGYLHTEVMGCLHPLPVVFVESPPCMSNMPMLLNSGCHGGPGPFDTIRSSQTPATIAPPIKGGGTQNSAQRVSPFEGWPAANNRGYLWDAKGEMPGSNFSPTLSLMAVKLRPHEPPHPVRRSSPTSPQRGEVGP